MLVPVRVLSPEKKAEDLINIWPEVEAFYLKDDHLLAVHFIQNIDKHLLTIAKLFEKVSGCRKSDLKAKSRVIPTPFRQPSRTKVS